MTDALSAEDCLLAWLSLEREAVWFYPYAGARVDDLADRARDAAAAHVSVRDRLIALVQDDTTIARPTYDVGPVTSADEARLAARRIERKIQAACLAYFRAAAPDDRPTALRGLRRAALAEISWSGSPHAFPGLD